jgi:acyl carrier protein
VSDDVLSVIREVLGSRTRDPRIHSAPAAEVSLHSLPIDSVEMIGVILELEERFGRVIDQAEMFELRTLADLVRALEASP